MGTEWSSTNFEPGAALDASRYDEQWLQLSDFLKYNPGSRHRRRLLSAALAEAGPAERVLDVGCGLGETIQFLVAKTPTSRFTGADFSAIAVDECRSRMPQHDWVVADITVGPVEGEFDAVICSEVLEHLDDPAAAVANLSDSLRPGGVLILTVPHGPVFATERAVGHVRHPSIGELGSWLDRSSLDLVRWRCWGFPGYFALKWLANRDPELAMRQLASGAYGPGVKALNHLAYWGTGATSIPNSRRGVQSVVTAVRR